MKDLSSTKLAFIPAFIMVVMVFCTITGCNLLEKDLTGGVELIMKVETEEAIIRETQLFRRQSLVRLKEAGITFSATAVKKTDTIEISGLKEQDKRKVQDILYDVSDQWGYKITGDNITLTLKQGAADRLKNQAVAQSLEVIKKRLSTYGVNEKYVEIEPPGSESLKVRIPPDVDSQRIKSLIRQMGILEFLPVVSGPFPSVEDALAEYNGTLPDDLKVLKGDPRNREKEYFIVKAYPVITGRDVKKTKRTQDQFGAPSVSFSLDSRGAKRIQTYTAANIGKKLAIVLDNRVLTAPVIRDVLSYDMVVSGRFTIEEAEDLALILRAGALPAPVTLLQEKIIEKEKK
jgi:preprotein translocase subunit SecD